MGKAQTFLLPWPPSVNSIWRAYKGRNILSQQARAWNDTASKELAIQRPKAIKGPVAITIELSPPTKRAWDFDNRLKLCLDLLVRSTVIEADDTSIVQELHAKLGVGFTGARITVSPIPAHSKRPGEEFFDEKGNLLMPAFHEPLDEEVEA